MKVLVALRIPGVDAAELAQLYRRHVIEAMQQYTRLKEAAAEDDLGLLLVADAEIYRLEAVIRWLDAADARIARLPRRASGSCRRSADRRGAGWGHGDERAKRANGPSGRERDRAERAERANGPSGRERRS